MQEQLTKEEYENKMRNFRFTQENIAKMLETMEKISQKSIQRSNLGIGNNNCLGNYLYQCDTCYMCFELGVVFRGGLRGGGRSSGNKGLQPRQPIDRVEGQLRGLSEDAPSALAQAAVRAIPGERRLQMA